MKICVFPNDPLRAYHEKGEIKRGYFNPADFFDEVHVISLFDSDIEESEVSQLAGRAEFKIHVMGKPNLLNYKKFEPGVLSVLSEIRPDIIRAYNPVIQGQMAVRAGRRLGVTSVISVHTNYDKQREFLKKTDLLRYLKTSYLMKNIERSSLRDCSAVIAVYRHIMSYVEKMGRRDAHLIYNRVDLRNFSANARKSIESAKPIILSVGRLMDQRPQKYLIEAVKDMDVMLYIIGDGPNGAMLRSLARSLGIEEKVRFVPRVPNKDLPGYYAAASIFAQPLEDLVEVGIPILEAMACGLPVVMSEHPNEDHEIVNDSAVFVRNDPEAFRAAFERILDDKAYAERLKRLSLETIREFGGNKMEEQELDLYKDLMGLE